MAILAFQKPNEVVVKTSSDTFGCFEFHPLEPGYGQTIGNSLRRILLASLEGYAISQIKINGVDQEFQNIPGFKEKSIKRGMDSVRASLQVPYDRVLFALGIRFVGETVAKILAHAFPNIDALAAATLDDLLQVDGIGTVIAESVIRYFADARNREIVEGLRANGLQMALAEEVLSERSDKLKGLSIVISGVFTHHSRDEYKALIEKHGGKNVGSISGKTSFILAGENMGPSKLEKAQKLGVSIGNEEEFLKMIE